MRHLRAVQSGGILSPKSRRDENGRWSSCGAQCFSQARSQVWWPTGPWVKSGESGYLRLYKKAIRRIPVEPPVRGTVRTSALLCDVRERQNEIRGHGTWHQHGSPGWSKRPSSRSPAPPRPGRLTPAGPRAKERRWRGRSTGAALSEAPSGGVALIYFGRLSVVELLQYTRSSSNRASLRKTKLHNTGPKLFMLMFMDEGMDVSMSRPVRNYASGHVLTSCTISPVL